MDDFLGNVFGDDLGRIAFSIGVFENESRFGRFDHLAVGRSRKEQTASGDDNQTGGEGGDFRHKERHLSSRLAACATDFCGKNKIFFNAEVGVIDLNRLREKVGR